MIIIHCMLKKDYEVIKENPYYGDHLIKTDQFIHFSTWNSFYDIAPSFMQDDKEKVFLCVDTNLLESELKWEEVDKEGIYYPHLYGLLNMNSVVDIVPFDYQNGIWNKNKCTHILMNTSCIDEDWCYPSLSNYINTNDKVCVVAFSFWENTKTLKDWNHQYQKPNGLWYQANTEVWKRYGIKEENVEWINYFSDSKESAKNKILNSSIVFFTGGAPDLMMKRIIEFELKDVLERYQGIMIGYSAGAMIQLNHYHITPDSDYSTFSYEQGLDCINEFDIEVHYEETKVQKKHIHKVLKETKKDIYAIYDDGGMIVEEKTKTIFGKVKKFTNSEIE